MRRETIYDEVFDAQQHFRLILDSMARPGKINVIPKMAVEPPAGINQASALAAFALLNTDVTFYAEGEGSSEIEGYIALNTTASPASVGDADFIFVDGMYEAGIVFDAKTGILPYPENSATFILSVTVISASDGDLKLTLKGPGIETTTEVYINGVNPEIFKAVREQNLEFPLGIDLIITDKENNIICLPRSNRFSLEFAEVPLAGNPED